MTVVKDLVKAAALGRPYALVQLPLRLYSLPLVWARVTNFEMDKACHLIIKVFICRR